MKAGRPRRAWRIHGDPQLPTGSEQERLLEDVRRKRPTWLEDLRFLLLYSAGSLAITVLLLAMLQGFESYLRAPTTPEQRQTRSSRAF